MKDLKRLIRNSTVTGSFASLSSLAALVLRARAEGVSPWAPLNAPSHWLWGEEALRQDDPSLRYTAVGVVIHHLSAGFWGVLHEFIAPSAQRPKPASVRVRDAALGTAVAAWVDLRLVPKRLTPGFERRLSGPSLAVVYALFAAGLCVGSYLANRGEEGPADEQDRA